MWDKPPPLTALQDTIADPSNPIGKRMRAAYYLRHAYSHNPQQSGDDNDNDDNNEHRKDPEALEHIAVQKIVVETLESGLMDVRHGSLMRHEFAYVLGQLRDERCCDTLERILLNESDCVMVRHEAAEALGAIGLEPSMPALQKILDSNTTPPELSETCRLAIYMMEWRSNQRNKEKSGENDNNITEQQEQQEEEMPVYCACMTNPYSTVDPAPPHPSHATKTVRELGDILLDDNNDKHHQYTIFDRYRAMFSLRNRGGVDAVQELCRALVNDTSSALLRHEVAYVLGQLQHPASVDALAESLRRSEEHFMVRHESAEALGAIEGARWDEVEAILREFSNDSQAVVRESCLVALDAADYWGHATAVNDDDDDDGNDADVVDPAEENKEADQQPHVLSFAHQKAIVPDSCAVAPQTNKWRNHHFNVAEESSH